jgi:hypothetical protein
MERLFTKANGLTGCDREMEKHLKTRFSFIGANGKKTGAQETEKNMMTAF